MTKANVNYEYQVGGSLSSSAPSYIVRQADSELYQALIDGEFCYVFNSRQMGKSSLRVRVKDTLEARGFTCVSIDMTSIGSQNITPRQWYKGITAHIWRGLNLIDRVNFKQWWQQHEDLAPLQCLGLFIEEIVLNRISTEKIFIFIDEIDSILSLDFAVDDFFALIRHFYNLRGENSAYNRLTFALFGVTTPSDLISDRKRTPFNIGRAIELKGFQVREALDLAKGLEDKFQDPQAILQAIIYWTGGQPFLTQKLCQIALLQSRQYSNKILLEEEVRWIDELVLNQLIKDWETHDQPEHFKTIADRLLGDEKQAGRILGQYREILLQDRIPLKETTDRIELLLSGLIVKKERYLQIRNPIYREVFDLYWVKQQLDKLRPYAKSLNAWQESLGRDSSRLLRGKALQDAQIWAHNHSLNEQDYQFLAASRDLEQKEKQQALEIEKLREIEARLKQEEKIARQQRAYLATLGLALVAAIALGGAAFAQYRKSAINEIRATINSANTLFISNRQFDSLIEAIRAKERMEKLNIDDDKLNSSVNETLHRAVYGVKEYNHLSGHLGTVFAVAISPDGDLIATAGEDKNIKIWQSDGNLLLILEGHAARIWDLEFSPDSQTLVSASRDKTVKIWHREGKLIATLNAHQDAVMGVAIAPDGRTIFSVSRDRTIKTWKFNGELINSQIAHDAEIRNVAISPDGSLLATASDDRTVKLWRVAANGILEPVPTKIFASHTDEVLSVTFSPNGQFIACGGQDNLVRIWQTNGDLIATLKGHTAPVSEVKFYENSQHLVSVSWDRTIKIWGIDGTLLQTIIDDDRRIWGVDLSPDNKSIATTSDRIVKLWQPDNSLIKVLRGHSAAVINVTHHPEGKIIASGGDDKTIKFWSDRGDLLGTEIGDGEAILGLTYSPDGKNLVSGHSDGTIQLRTFSAPSLTTSKKVIEGHTALVWGIAYSPDGKMFASASEDNTVKLWSESGESIATLRGHTDSVRDVAFSPDGKLIASASLDSTVKIWSRRGKLLGTLKGHDAAVITVKFRPTVIGNTYGVASGSWDKTVKLWQIIEGDNIVTTNLKKTLVGHQDAIKTIDFSPDGTLVATGGGDNSIRLWNLQGKLLKTLFGHQDAIWQIDFDRQGKKIVSSSEDKTVIIWDLEQIYELDLLDYGCNWIKDYLTTNIEVKNSASRKIRRQTLALFQSSNLAVSPEPICRQDLR